MCTYECLELYIRCAQVGTCTVIFTVPLPSIIFLPLLTPLEPRLVISRCYIVVSCLVLTLCNNAVTVKVAAKDTLSLDGYREVSTEETTVKA